MSAPIGNQNAAKGKRWLAAIERAIASWPNEPSPEGKSQLMIGIDKAAHLFVKNLLTDNNLAYFKEFGDRLDGKPAQTILGDEENPLQVVSKVVREIVKP